MWKHKWQSSIFSLSHLLSIKWLWSPRSVVKGEKKLVLTYSSMVLTNISISARIVSMFGIVVFEFYWYGKFVRVALPSHHTNSNTPLVSIGDGCLSIRRDLLVCIVTIDIKQSFTLYTKLTIRVYFIMFN